MIYVQMPGHWMSRFVQHVFSPSFFLETNYNHFWQFDADDQPMVGFGGHPGGMWKFLADFPVCFVEIR